MCKWIQIFLASIILLISCTQESGGGSQEGPNDNNQTKTELATLQDIVDNANAGETINLADYTDLTDYNAVINKSLKITNGSLNDAKLTVTSENVKLDNLSDLSVKSLSKLTINDSKLNDLLLGTGEVSRSAAVTSSAMAMASVTNCEIGNVKMLGFNSQLNITDTSTKITNIATSTKCKIVLEKGSYIDMKDPKVTGSGELVRIDMTKDMELSVLSIYQNPNKIEYNVGENFDKSGLIVMGTYFASVEIFKNDWKGEAKESVTKWEDEKDYEIVVPDLSTAGVKIVEITSNINKNVKCCFHIFVKSDDSTAAAITVSNVSVRLGKKDYKVGEMLDLSGFRVIGNYGNFEINLPYTSVPADGTVLNKAGNKEVTFYYHIGDTTGSVIAEISVTAEEDSSEQQPTGETFTITFNANDGSGDMNSQTAKKGEETTLTANVFTRSGYTFSGWATSADGNGSKYEDKAQITLTENLTLYAQWTEIGKVDQVTFSITGEVDYNTTVTLSCGTDGATIYYATAEVTDIPPTLSEILLSKQEYSEPIAITENVTIAAIAVKGGMTDSEPTYATFTVKTYTVTFETEHGTEPAPIQNLKKGYKLTEEQLKEPGNVIGYTFGGWYYGENNEFTAGTEITSNVTLTAEWEANKYTVKFDKNADDATGSNINDIQTFYDTEFALPENGFSKIGYNFGGWNTKKDGSGTTHKAGEKLKNLSAENDDVVTLYAQWTEITTDNIGDIIKNLIGNGPHDIAVSGVTNNTISKIKTALDNNNTKKINLDLSKTTGLTEIPQDAFNQCSNLTSIKIPNSIESICSFAFYNCIALENVEIEGGIKYICSSAFNGCSNLTSVTIPDTLEQIGNGAFDNCNKLTTVNYGGTVDEWNAFKSNPTFGDFNDALLNANIICTNGAITTAENAASVIGGLSEGNHIIVVTGDISEKFDDIAIAVKNNNANVSLNLSKTTGLTEIPQNAFKECNNLTNIIIPDSVTSIEHYAFYSCSALENVTIGNEVTGIWNFAFGSCGKLKSITIPDSVTTIGNMAFDSCNSLTSIIIPDSVTSIYSQAFGQCFALENVTIGSGVKEIVLNTFGGCGSLTSITIPNSVTTIGKGAFKDCDKLANVNYRGNEEQWNAIIIGENNGSLTSATKNYGYTGE